MANRASTSRVADPEPAPAETPDNPPLDPQARARWRAQALLLVLVSLALGILIGGYTGYYQYTRPAVYKSSAALLIDQEPAALASGDEGILGKLSRLRLTYASLINTTVFATPVAQQAQLPVGEVRGALSATADLNTMLVVITAAMHDQKEAKVVAQLASDHMVSYLADQQQRLGIKPTDRVTFQVVTPAGDAVKTAPSNKKAVLEGAVVFAVITAVGALGADLLRRRKV